MYWINIWQFFINLFFSILKWLQQRRFGNTCLLSIESPGGLDLLAQPVPYCWAVSSTIESLRAFYECIILHTNASIFLEKSGFIWYWLWDQPSIEKKSSWSQRHGEQWCVRFVCLGAEKRSNCLLKISLDPHKKDGRNASVAGKKNLQHVNLHKCVSHTYFCFGNFAFERKIVAVVWLVVDLVCPKWVSVRQHCTVV